MNCRVSEDIPSGLYRSIDNIENFKIKIRIQKSIPQGLLQLESPDCSQSENIELHPLCSQDKKIILEQVFSWQEKVSKEGEGEISASSLRTSKSSSRFDSHIKLFTCVDSELRSSEPKTIVQRRCSEADILLKRKNLFLCADKKTYQKPFIVDSKDVIQNTVAKKPYDFVGQMMAIMALLDTEDSSENFKEVQICLIQYDSHGVLRITPDFSKTPYFVQNCSTEIFEVIIENASQSMDKCEIEKNRKLLKQIATHHAKTLDEAVGATFDKPSEDTVQYMIYGEIATASEFDADCIFVRCSFEVNKDLLMEGDELLSTVSHSCKTKWKNSIRVAEFGYPFSHEMRLSARQLHSLDGIIPHIRLIIEVISVDYWGILRSEGYGFASLSLHPGIQNFNVRTWKLLPKTIHGKLRNFFLGGSPCLQDSSFVTVPKDLQDPHLNKSGVISITSGSVDVKIHLIVHYGCESRSHDFIHKQQVTSNH